MDKFIICLKPLFCLLIFVGVLFQCNTRSNSTLQRTQRPNILIAIADDQSFPYASIYGTKGVNTPTFDRVARDGALFTNAFAAAPQCSPSRAAILTGKNIWQLEEAGTHASYFPKIPVFTDVLEESGYHIGYTGKAWGPGDWQTSGWERNPVGPAFNEYEMKAVPTSGIKVNDYFSNFKAFLEKRSGDQPFFFWYGGHEPHRGYEYGSGKKSGRPLEEVEVPKFLPDTEVVKNDVNDYAFEIEWFDKHLGKMLAFLEEKGQLDNTIVVVTADNGMPFPYAKANLQEYGTHVPLAICWPQKISSNQVIEELVSLIDLAPTFLDLAELDQLPATTGKSMAALLFNDDEYVNRKYVFTGRERHTHARPNNLGYPVRAIHSKEYLYVRNLNPALWPAGDPVDSSWKEVLSGTKFKGMWPGYHDVDDSPSKMLILDNKEEYTMFFNLAYEKRASEQLYHIAIDPFCIDNVISDPKYAEVRKELSIALESELKAQGDPRMFGRSIFDSYPRVSSMREFEGFKERRKYNPEYLEEGQKIIN
ncbi:MAG: sulfatase [Bacteroidota bacterium]